MIEVLSQGFDGGKRCLRFEAGGLLQTVYEHPECPQPLRNILEGAVAWQKRNEYKSGTALRTIPQYTAVLLALGTQVTIGEDRETLSDFIERSGPVGKLTDIYVPLDVAGRVYGESHVRRTPTDTPIVSAIAGVDIADGVVKQARLAFTGVWDDNVRLAKAANLLIGKPLDTKTIADIAAAIQEEVNPKGNYLGSVEYRRAMAGVTIKRALEICSMGGMLS